MHKYIIDRSSIQVNYNITLPSVFVTPTINQIGYIINGSIIADLTTISNAITYTVSQITVDPGVYILFGQISWQITAVSTTPTLSYNAMSISTSSSVSTNIIENRTPHTVNTNQTFSEQITRIQTVTSTTTFYLLHAVVLSNCTVKTRATTSLFTATRIA